MNVSDSALTSQDFESIQLLYQSLWKRKTELESELELEKELHQAIEELSYQYTKVDINEAIRLQFAEFCKNGPLQEQVNILREEISNSANKNCIIEQLTNEVNELDEENFILSEAIDNFEDPELHRLRAKKQHIELTRKF